MPASNMAPTVVNTTPNSSSYDDDFPTLASTMPNYHSTRQCKIEFIGETDEINFYLPADRIELSIRAKARKIINTKLGVNLVDIYLIFINNHHLICIIDTLKNTNQCIIFDDYCIEVYEDQYQDLLYYYEGLYYTHDDYYDYDDGDDYYDDYFYRRGDY
jgi:hypothetical protein